MESTLLLRAACAVLFITGCVSGCNRGLYERVIDQYCLAKFKFDMEAVDQRLWCSWPDTTDEQRLSTTGGIGSPFVQEHLRKRKNDDHVFLHHSLNYINFNRRSCRCCHQLQLHLRYCHPSRMAQTETLFCSTDQV
ncbi:uncharacterized protein LOC133480099 isoform X2 [Phyllopteryx taeniolatus]|uniref:uncharacterized protein LOC133480099 isoform X2 n=1 Tax=Phyllopteryx taeniolatus TaxID=161469 RepID=UPI002AD3294D|nr:uncharacterized protein LOC133480099 isoform X2 [Phyllopteryx taeniolatus]